jgi:NTP pyrophosphatase (non-canonical NTP hydrolase)
MNIQQYIEKTKETAVYPSEKAISYVALGLSDEAGEFHEKASKYAGARNKRYGQKERKSLAGELGDVMWYTARIIDELDIDTEQFQEELDQDISGSPLGPQIKQIGEYSEQLLLSSVRVNGRIKKIIRGDDGKEEKIEDIAQNLKTIFSTMKHISHHAGFFSLETVMSLNVNKLLDRSERNVLRGDGDNR